MRGFNRGQPFTYAAPAAVADDARASVNAGARFMPRRARLTIPDVPLHIIQRGNNRCACFHRDDDYVIYVRLLGELASRYNCRLHAYALMTNHVHLLMTPMERESAAQLMKNLGQRYVQYVNRTYRRSGTLWEGRFRSCIASGECYVLTCYRYIELNPVRAGTVSHPGDYAWSSYLANAEGRCSSVVPHADYLALAESDGARREAYRDLFRAPPDAQLLAEIRSATNGNFALGSDRFRLEAAAALGRRVTRGKPGRPAKTH
jgi:putative transposase